MLKSSRCSKELALALMSATMIAYLNGADTMATKGTKKVKKAGGPPADETSSQAFRRLAHKRTNKAVKTMNMICGLTGSAYAATDTEKAAIVVALQAAVDGVKDAFAGKCKDAGGFSLPT